VLRSHERRLTGPVGSEVTLATLHIPADLSIRIDIMGVLRIGFAILEVLAFSWTRGRDWHSASVTRRTANFSTLLTTLLWRTDMTISVEDISMADELDHTALTTVLGGVAIIPALGQVFQTSNSELLFVSGAFLSRQPAEAAQPRVH
jgi:hypothetical protein